MAVISSLVTTNTPLTDIDYPTSDGRPMAESDLHREVMVAAIDTLQLHYTGQPVYVSGNILLFYRPGDKLRHVSPDVLVVLGLEPRSRDNYLLWEEGRAPNVVIEVTSPSTRKEDLKDKLKIYRDEIGVAEYFLFDPRSEYLNPVLQGHRLRPGRYMPIAPVAGRLPSQELGLHLEADGSQLRFYDPASERWLPTRLQQTDAALKRSEAGRRQSDAALEQSEAGRQQAEAALKQKDAGLRQAEAEAERLRQELAALRRQP